VSELPVTPPETDPQTMLAQTSDDDAWPPPPSPITESPTSAISPGAEQAETSGSSSPVVRFTFTVKLDSQLLKRRRQQLDLNRDTSPTTAASLAVEDVADVDNDQTLSASPQSPAKQRPEMAVVIPDVVVCADAVESKKSAVGSAVVSERQQPARQPTPNVLDVTDSAAPLRRGCTASRSCQTELGDASFHFQFCLKF